MNLLDSVKEHLKIYIVIVILVILFIISYLIYVNSGEEVQASGIVLDDVIDQVNENISLPEEVTKINVDVKGYVINPGVYELEENSRVIDVINASGGLSEGADTSNLNLSKKLKDENVIIVGTYKKEEPIIITQYVYEECHCEEINNACIKEEDIVNFIEDIKDDKQDTKDEIKEEIQENKKISINTASIDELQTLSGIGESKALSIIKYREEYGLFNTIEDIMNVPGIGEALFEKIKDDITI